MKEYADDMQEWSRLVLSRYQNRCAWVGCGSTWGLGAHHVFRRANKRTRLLIDNGLALCTVHHDFVESVKGNDRYLSIMRLLIGQKRYSRVEAIAKDSTMIDLNVEITTPASEIDF